MKIFPQKKIFTSRMSNNDKQSRFLVAQQPIEDPLEQIDMLPLMVVQRNYFMKENEEPIPQNQYDLIEKLFFTVDPSGQVYSQDMLPTETVYNGYKWTQKSNQITITYNSEEEVKEEDIKITETDVSSPFLSGNFYDKVSNPQISISGKKVKITLTSSRPFLVLIKSGENMDKYSQFFLGAFASKVGMMDLFDKLLIKSAFSGLVMAMTSLAVSYLQREEREKAIYWFYQFVQKTNELFAYVTIADSLLFIDPARYAFLCENILIKIAPKFPQAFVFLARMHLDDFPGFNSSDELAANYLKYAVQNQGSPDAFRMLARLYIVGRGVKRDVNLGSELLRETGASDEQIKEAIQLFTEAEEKRTGKPISGDGENKESLADTIADYSIATAILVGVAAAGVYLYTRFLNRRK